MEKVAVLICTEDDKNPHKEKLKTLVSELTENIEYLELVDLDNKDCKKVKKEDLESFHANFKKLLLFVNDPYSDDTALIVEKLRVAGFETHMIKTLRIDLFTNSEGFNVNLLEAYLRYWGAYMAKLSRRKLTLTVSRFKNKMKRRDLLVLMKKGFLERRFLPSITEEACILDRGCTKCIDFCPVDALKPIDVKNRKIEVYETKCVGCGICESVCPTNAIEVHGTSNEVLATSMTEFLSHSHEEPILVTSCNVMLSKLVQQEALDVLKSENVFNLELDCVGRMDPITSLYFLGAGVKGIVYLDCEGECPYKIKEPLIKENYEFTQKLLKGFKQDENRVKLVSIRDKNGLRNKLKEAVEEIGQAEIKHKRGEIRVFDRGENKFKRAVFDFKEITGITPDGEFESKIYGPSTINIDEVKCTMCKACVYACPTYAFHMKQEENFKLNFILSNCVSCGYCVDVCPENALSIDYKFDLRDVAEATVTLMKEDEIAKCRNCGAPIGPLSTLKKVERTLKLKWDGNPKIIESIYYCEKCKKLKALGLID